MSARPAQRQDPPAQRCPVLPPSRAPDAFPPRPPFRTGRTHSSEAAPASGSLLSVPPLPHAPSPSHRACFRDALRFPVFSGRPGGRTWSEGTLAGRVPTAPWAGASGLRAAPKSVSVGPGTQGLGRTSGRCGRSRLISSPSTCLAETPAPRVGWAWVLAVGRGAGAPGRDSGWKAKLLAAAAGSGDCGVVWGPDWSRGRAWGRAAS